MASDAYARIRERLAFVAEAIDNGRYSEPEGAADAMLDTVLSIYGPHRDDLLLVIVQTPRLEDPTPETCPECGGSGMVFVNHGNGVEHYVPCPLCGTGQGET